MKHLRKLSVIFCLMLIVCGAALVFSACNEHKHDYIWLHENGEHWQQCQSNPEHVTPKEPCEYTLTEFHADCEHDGYKQYTCSVCGDEYQISNGEEKTGHNYSSTYEHRQVTEDGEIKHYHFKPCLNSNCDDESEVSECTFEAAPPVEPTCLTEGYTLYTCRDCGYSFKADEKEALGHSYIYQFSEETHKHTITCENCDLNEEHDCLPREIEIKSAGCDTDGYTKYECTVCQGQWQETSPEQRAHGHAWGDWTYVAGQNKHRRVCAYHPDEHIEENACTFDFVGVVIDPTCTTEGYTRHDCTEPTCINYQIDNEVEPLQHDFSDGWIKDDEHTHTQTCKRLNCGYHETVAHVFNENEIPPTCEDDGYIRYSCGACDYYYDVINAEKLNHNYQYSYNDDQKSHTVTCSRCMLNIVEDCEFVDEAVVFPTCDDDGHTIHQCTICQGQYQTTSEEQKAHGHAWSPWQHIGQNKHARVCEYNQEHREEKDCVFDEVGYSVPATCERGGYTRHDCLEETCVNYQVSDEGSPLGHEYDKWKYEDEENHYHTCTRENCGHIEREPHAYNDSITPPTCYDDGVITHTCGTCDHTYTEPGEPATHAFTNWEIGTGEYEGMHIRKCTVCHYVDAVVHDEDKNICSVCGHDKLVYTLINSQKAYAVTGITSSAKVKTIVIPATHNDCPVTKIADYTLWGFAAGGPKRVYESFTVEGNNLVEIGSYVMSSVDTLVSVKLPSSVTKIGRNAFSYCPKLENVEFDASSLTRVELDLFKNTPYSAKAAEKTGGVFYINNVLLFVANPTEDFECTVVEGTTEIFDNAFAYCKQLTKIHLPMSLQRVGLNAFFGCENLTETTYAGDTYSWFEIEFANDEASPLYLGSAFHIDKITDTTIVLPDTVKKIPAGTFRNDDTLVSITLPENLTYIGEDAFEGCTALTTVIVNSEKLAHVGHNAFDKTPFFENGWNGENAFYLECSSGNKVLIKVKTEEATFVIKDNTVCIAENAFEGCTNLSTVTISAAVETIGAHAFKGCNKLTSAIFEDLQHAWFANKYGSMARQYTPGENTAKNAVNLLSMDGEWTKLQ